MALITTIFLLIWASNLSASDTDTHVTKVRTTKPKSEYETQEPSSKSMTESPLERISSVTLSKSGGPLAPVDVKIRGLSSHRLNFELEGLTLNDPVDGLFDASSLPFFIGLINSPVGQQVGFSLPESNSAFAKSQMELGSFTSVRANFLGGSAKTRLGQVLVGTEIGTTKGNFTFAPNSTHVLARTNNDQLRISAFTMASTGNAKNNGQVLFFFHKHDGGIPGFALAPTNFLRGESEFLGTVLKGKFSGNRNIIYEPKISSRFVHKKTFEPYLENLSEIYATEQSVETVITIPFPANISKLSIGSNIGWTNLIYENINRINSGTTIEYKKIFENIFSTTIQTKLILNEVSDAGFLYGGFFITSIVPVKPLTIGIKLAKSPRAPTISELYAPKGIILGNPNLLPESSYEIENFVSFVPTSAISMRASAFYGFLTEAILYVNRNAFEIAPINTGGLHRAGIDVGIEFVPHRLVGIYGNGQYIYSKLLATNEQLPGTPPLSARIKFRVGPEDFLRGLLKITYRSETASNLYGGLVSPPYVMFDGDIIYPFNQHFLTNLSVTNIFDVQNARDSHQFPLPGRAFFALLELKS